MLELIFSCFHRFFRVQKPPKSVVTIATNVNRSKVMAKSNFGSLTSIFGYNFTQNIRNIELSQAKRLSYLIDLFCWHILARFKENPRNGFSVKSQKLPKLAKNGFFSHKWAVFEKTAKNLKKAVMLHFLQFSPNLVPSFGKILGAVPEIIRHGQTTGSTNLIL